MQTQEVKVIEVGAALIFCSYDILLLENTSYKKYGGPYMGPPGGKRDGNESFQKCIKREVKEELGIDVIVRELVGISEFDLSIGRHRVNSHRALHKGKPRILEPEKIASVKTYTFADLKKMYEDKILVQSLVDLYERELIQPYMIER